MQATNEQGKWHIQSGVSVPPGPPPIFCLFQAYYITKTGSLHYWGAKKPFFQ